MVSVKSAASGVVRTRNWAHITLTGAERGGAVWNDEVKHNSASVVGRSAVMKPAAHLKTDVNVGRDNACWDSAPVQLGHLPLADTTAATTTTTTTRTVDLCGRCGHTYNCMPANEAARPPGHWRTDGQRYSRTDGRQSTRAEQMKNGLVPDWLFHWLLASSGIAARQIVVMATRRLPASCCCCCGWWWTFIMSPLSLRVISPTWMKLVWHDVVIEYTLFCFLT